MVSRDAVIAPDGFSYPGPEIKAWLDDPRSGQRSPMTGVPLVPNADRSAQHRALLAYPRLVRLIAAAEKNQRASSAPYLTEDERQALWQLGHPGTVVWEAMAALETLGWREVPHPDPDNVWARLVAGYRVLQRQLGPSATGPAEVRLRTLARLTDNLSEERLRRDRFMSGLAVKGSDKPRRPEGTLEGAHPELVDVVTFETAERPVVASDGHVYDARTIPALRARDQRSPLTREPLDDEVYVHRTAEATIRRLEGRDPPATAPTATLIAAGGALPSALRRQGALEERARGATVRANQLASPDWWARNGWYVGAVAGVGFGGGLIELGAWMRRVGENQPAPPPVHTPLGNIQRPPAVYGVGTALAVLGAVFGVAGVSLASLGGAVNRRRAHAQRDTGVELDRVRESLAEVRAQIAEIQHGALEPRPAPGGGPKPPLAAVMAAAQAVERAVVDQAGLDRVEAWSRAHPPPDDLPGAIARPSEPAHPPAPQGGGGAHGRPASAFEIEIVVDPGPADPHARPPLGSSTDE